MNAPVRIPRSDHASDRQFLRQLKVANRQQLRAMLDLFRELVPDGCNWNHKLAWKRALVERKLGINRSEFPWMKRVPMEAR